jgi:hypothetical protein
MEPTSLHFARTARSLTAAARANGLIAPTFRSPPRLAGATRTIRRTAEDRARATLWAAVPDDEERAA